MKPVRAMMTIVLLASAAAYAGPAAAPEDTHQGFGERWIATRLSLGARFSWFWLQDTRRSGENGYDNSNLGGNFLGSLWGLDAQQHAFPSPYLEYRALSGLGVGVSYDQQRAKTLDWANEDHTTTAGDGDVEIRGIGAYLVARLRNRTRFEPYAELGFAWYHSHFYESPGWSAPGRRFVVEDTDGWFAAAGFRVGLGGQVAIDAVYRYSHVGDVEARAYLVGNHYRGGAFPMRSDLLGIGASYTF
jgi:opacity protein-like surface antigen